MTKESRINEALKHLGEEHRLGMVRTEEFRSRRRALLESWGDAEATTAPGGGMRHSMSTTQTNPGAIASAARPPGPGLGSRAWVGAVLLGAAVIGIASWMLLRPSTSPYPRGAPASRLAERSDALLAVMREASAFRNRNRWEARDTAAFLTQWRGLTAEDRRMAQEEPALRSLLYELEQNIAAERQALEYSPNAEGQARLDRLQAFAEELTETSP